MRTKQEIEKDSTFFLNECAGNNTGALNGMLSLLIEIGIDIRDELALSNKPIIQCIEEAYRETAQDINIDYLKKEI